MKRTGACIHSIWKTKLERYSLKEPTMPGTDNERCQTVQDTVLEKIEVFSQNNPEIVEALGLMNLTMADYLQAVEAIRAALPGLVAGGALEGCPRRTPKGTSERIPASAETGRQGCVGEVPLQAGESCYRPFEQATRCLCFGLHVSGKADPIWGFTNRCFGQDRIL